MNDSESNDDIIIDPLSDIFVLYLFGSPENNRVLLDFINAVLGDVDFEEIIEVEVLNPFNLRTFVNDKLSILDVKAKDNNGRIYDVHRFLTSLSSRYLSLRGHRKLVYNGYK